MKININRNILWTTLFTDFLVKSGIKYACISPGSRNTPLTFAIASEKKIKSFPIIDERTSGFFALGIAKGTGLPVVILTTSGTATAELYPAIIEAYQSRVPLIICTSDRPAYLRNTGANQTINQKDIYKNHIRYSADLPLPSPDKISLSTLLNSSFEAIKTAVNLGKGPVHLNFQFEKPFEPDTITDTINDSLIEFAYNLSDKLLSKKNSELNYNNGEFKLNRIDLITVGAGIFNDEFKLLLKKLSSEYNIPIFADANSGLRFSKTEIPNLISNYEALIRSNRFSDLYSPENVLHFGRNLTSQNLEEFLVKSKVKRIIVNEFGDRFDTTKKAEIIKCEPEYFLKYLLREKILSVSSTLLEKLKTLDHRIESIKTEIFRSDLNEVNLILQLIDLIPENSNLFIGNSLPVRDLDFFAPKINKSITVFQNRGASGIDGIISTAAGISMASKKPTYLIIGDLSFYYDLNSLLIIKKFNIPVKIILINNQGGGIFNYLPVSRYKKIFKDYFLTPSELNFGDISKAFGIKYKLVKSLSDYKKSILNSKKLKSSLILEVRTNSLFTKSLKEKFWSETGQIFV